MALGRTAEQYLDQLRSLLPHGPAWAPEFAPELDRVLAGLAMEFERIEGRGLDLLAEMEPTTINELLPDWERVAGLPDRCNGKLEDTLQGRRNALLSKINGTGGQSIAYFTAITKALGFEVTITEYRPFRAGVSVAGDPLTNGDWIFTWRVNAPETTVISFRAGRSCAGEPLLSWGNGSLECKLNQLKPAHTHVLFSYGAPEAEQTFSAADRLFFAANYELPNDLEAL